MPKDQRPAKPSQEVISSHANWVTKRVGVGLGVGRGQDGACNINESVARRLACASNAPMTSQGSMVGREERSCARVLVHQEHEKTARDHTRHVFGDVWVIGLAGRSCPASSNTDLVNELKFEPRIGIPAEASLFCSEF